MSDSVGLILQARMGSSRLPCKVLRPFHDGKSILELLIDRFHMLSGFKLIVATTNNEKDKPIVEFCKQKGIFYFCGCENDVLSRFIGAAEEYQIDVIGRICSDNPFFDVSSLQEAISYFLNNSVDYVTFLINGKPCMQTHYGFWGEVVSLGTLKDISIKTIDSLYREHVTNYIYTHPEEFKIHYIVPRESYGSINIRLTVDTINDFNIASKVYGSVVKLYGNINIDNILSYIRGDVKMISSMKKEIESNQK